MIKDIRNLVDKLSTKKQNESGNIISQILKSERLKHAFTLEEVSSGICSVSSLSKLENNKSNAEGEFARIIFEKLGINYNRSLECNNDALIECVKNYYNNNLDFVESQYLFHAATPCNAVVLIINSFYFLMKNKYDELIIAVKNLNQIKNNLGYLEGLLFIYIVIYYYIVTYQFKNALVYLKEFEKLNITNLYINALYLEASLIIAFNLKIGSRLVETYKKIENSLFLGQNISKLSEQMMCYNAFIYDDYQNKVLKNLETLNFELISNDTILNVKYYYYLIKIKYCDLKEIFNEIVSYNLYVEAKILGLLAYLAYRINEFNYFTKLTAIISEINFNYAEEIHKKFCAFVLLIASDSENADIINYLDEHFLESEMYFYLYEEVYQNCYYYLLVDESKYKNVSIMIKKRIDLFAYPLNSRIKK